VEILHTSIPRSVVRPKADYACIVRLSDQKFVTSIARFHNLVKHPGKSIEIEDEQPAAPEKKEQRSK